MKILTGNKYKETLRDCKPTKIAVAYLGIDWKKIIPDFNSLEAMIISPNLGTHPRAIKELASHIGWERLFFLDELHAKTYIGRTSAIIGSANLANNGLSGKDLIELCVEITNDDDLKRINNFFNELMKLAQEQYDTYEKKKQRLIELEGIWAAAVVNQLAKDQDTQPAIDFANFELLGKDHFYVLWYQPYDDYEYSDDIKAIQSLIKEEIHFAKNDKSTVKINKWALLWRITNSNKFHKSNKLQWLYIHDIYEDGIVDKAYDYPMCAIQRKDKKTVSPPFKITKDVIEAFEMAINNEKNVEIRKYLIQQDRVFNLSDSLEGIPLLIKKNEGIYELVRVLFSHNAIMFPIN